jgi:putative restriction endonuclease
MRAFVAVTDADWYRYLAARPELSEVNFWRPGGHGRFRALAVGEPFFFKTHHPHNRIVGGGFYSGFTHLRISEAWDFFGPANGVSDLEQMRRRVGHYRREDLHPGDDPVIGCLFIRDARFFPAGNDAPPPPDFAPNVVQGKGYNLSTEPQHTAYFQGLLDRLLGQHIPVDLGNEFDEAWNRPGPAFGDPRLEPQRLGQQAFQAVVLEAYHRRCAITGTKIRPVLQAAHVRPLTGGGQHRLDNGLLLRSDVHTLFDRGYLAVDTKHRLLVSPYLRAEFGNGEQFYAHAGQTIAVPERRAERPHRDALEWHLDTVFKSS